jgi:hypothetical protein
MHVKFDLPWVNEHQATRRDSSVFVTLKRCWLHIIVDNVLCGASRDGIPVLVRFFAWRGRRSCNAENISNDKHVQEDPDFSRPCLVLDCRIEVSTDEHRPR